MSFYRTELRDSSFTEESKWHSMQTPFAKYDRKFELTTTRPFTKIIHKATSPISASTWKIPKLDNPGPGSYDYEGAFSKTQENSLTG